MRTTKWTQPRLIVLSRARDENVLAFCKGWESGTQSSNAEFSSCSYRTGEWSCMGCSDYQVS